LESLHEDPMDPNPARTIEEALARGIEAVPAPAVFVVDDDPLFRDLLGKWLEDAGFRTVRIADGKGCLAALSRERPAAVLLDLHLEGLSGFATLDFIRTADGDLPVIALLAEEDRGHEADLLERGADEFLRRPLNRSRLLRAVRSALGLDRAAA
jgi:DNA-binding response OmpR family regulator